MPSGIQLSAGIVVGVNKPIDAKYGPYASVAAALADIGATLRHKGLTVGIETNGSVSEYWFKDGTTNANFVEKSLGGGGFSPAAHAPYSAGNVSGNTTFDLALGAYQKASLTAAATIQVPTGGSEGMELELRLTASGADRALSFASGISIPSDSAIAFPKTLSNGKTYIVRLRRGATKWALLSLVGGVED